MLMSLDMYNVWFHGIQRALPVLKEERFRNREMKERVSEMSKKSINMGSYLMIFDITGIKLDEIHAPNLLL